MGGPRATNNEERRQRELEAKRRWYYKNRAKKIQNSASSPVGSTPTLASIPAQPFDLSSASLASLTPAVLATLVLSALATPTPAPLPGPGPTSTTSVPAQPFTPASLASVSLASLASASLASLVSSASTSAPPPALTPPPMTPVQPFAPLSASLPSASLASLVSLVLSASSVSAPLAPTPMTPAPKPAPVLPTALVSTPAPMPTPASAPTPAPAPMPTSTPASTPAPMPTSASAPTPTPAPLLLPPVPRPVSSAPSMESPALIPALPVSPSFTQLSISSASSPESAFVPSITPLNEMSDYLCSLVASDESDADTSSLHNEDDMDYMLESESESEGESSDSNSTISWTETFDLMGMQKVSSKWRCAGALREEHLFVKSAWEYFEEAAHFSERPIEEVEEFLQQQATQVSDAQDTVECIHSLFHHTSEQKRVFITVFGEDCASAPDVECFSRMIDFLQVAHFRANTLMRLHCMQVQCFSLAIETQQIHQHLTNYMKWWDAACVSFRDK